MTREEQIQEKANELYYTHAPYEATIAMAEWADEHPRKGLVDINEACNWLKENAKNYYCGYCITVRTEFINDFRKAMEELNENKEPKKNYQL